MATAGGILLYSHEAPNWRRPRQPGWTTTKPFQSPTCAWCTSKESLAPSPTRSTWSRAHIFLVQFFLANPILPFNMRNPIAGCTRPGTGELAVGGVIPEQRRRDVPTRHLASEST